MRVLVIAQDVVSYGGTSRFLERLLVIQARYGIETALLAPTGRCHSALASLAERHGTELIRSPDHVGPGTAPFLTPFFDLLFSWCAVLTKRPDLIVVTTGDPGRLSIALYYPVPVLYILHSVPEQRFRLLPRWYLRIGAMLNNRIMTVSAAAARGVSDFMGLPLDRIEVVHNSCAIPSCHMEPAMPIILTAGHLVPYKNPELWLEVARTVVQQCPDARFVWLGDGDLLETVRKKVCGMSLEERIMLPGYVSDPSVWYAQAQVYFQPSLRESHGIAVLEAMSHAVPCVVSDAGGLPESVIDGETGYVCPFSDSAAFVRRIVELLGNRKLRNHFGSAGRRRVEIIFSEEAQEHKIMALYERLMNRRDEP